ncbi:hypothetical protein MTO96_031718 [Rhipicephalus appendiculatus]
MAGMSRPHYCHGCSGGVQQVSPSGADSPAVEGVSDTPRSQFSDEGDSLLAAIPETDVLGIPSGSQRLITGTTQSSEGRHIPATNSNQEEDAQSSVSDATAVATGLRTDPGSREQARACELEDEISRFCADSSNRITGQLVEALREIAGLQR